MLNLCGELFPDGLLRQVRNRFYNVAFDPIANKKRVFFDNAGGSFRLKSANDAFKKIDELPDCPEHSNFTSLWLNNVQNKAYDNLRVLFNASSGTFVTSLTASSVMYEIVRAVIENVPGENVVTTSLEHPSAYDSVVTYAKREGKSLRVAEPNIETGGVDVESIVELIDKDTCLLSVIYASNISGSVLDIKTIVEEARKIKPDLYIVCDAVQHAPHGIIDVDMLGVDAANIAPYKFGCPRGIGIGYVSDRLSRLPHDKLLAANENKWELGSPPAGHFGAINEYVDYVCWIGRQFVESEVPRINFVEGLNRIKLHERALMHFALEGTEKIRGLRHIEGVTIYLDHADLSMRDFILALGIDGISPVNLVREYEKYGIITFARMDSSPYSSRMIESLRIESCVRVSPYHCHNTEDILKFLETTIVISKKR
ncbi:MAG: aminotransferase class V-fold PLP-dependent enzyme [Pseudomonadota bacterium]